MGIALEQKGLPYFNISRQFYSVTAANTVHALFVRQLEQSQWTPLRSHWLTTKIFKSFQAKSHLSTHSVRKSLYRLTFSLTAHIDCSSLEGKRAIGDVFDILDNAVAVGSSNAFVLQGIDDSGAYLSTVYQRDASGTFKPGRYVIGKPIQSAFLLWLSLYRSTPGKWSEDFPTNSGNVQDWPQDWPYRSAASEEGEG